MVLYPRGRGRGRGVAPNFQPEARHGGRIKSPGPVFRPAQPGMVCSPVGYPPGTAFGTLQNFGQPVRFNSHTPRRAFGKFRGKHYRRNVAQRHNENCVTDIDLTKPWVTDEIRCEESKSQQNFELWKETKSSENWSKYEAQKQVVQALYDNAKVEYAESHPNEAAVWENKTANKNYCETCDKSFRTSEDFLLHEAEHETCGREGCDFTAHPKIIAKHIKMQHESGLFKRIGKLYTEEDISKWIEERKKRYPTRKIVEEKKILEQEKLNRGEKIKEDDSKFNKSFSNRGRGREKKNFEKKTNKNRRTRKKKPVSVVQNLVDEEASSIRKGVPAFLGIKSVNEPVVTVKKDCDISDEEWETENKSQNTVKPLLNSSLGLLAMAYDSDVENKIEEPHVDTKTEISADEWSDPEEVSSKNPLPEQKLIQEKVPIKRKSAEKRDHLERKKQNTSNDGNFGKRSLTLLEKLLKNEIRHERNVILQCVHYVVKNNFFKM